MSSLNSKDSRGSASDKELIEEFDRILVKKGVTFDNLVPVDWDIVEEFLRENLSPFTPLPMSPPPTIIPAPSQIPRGHEYSDIRMSLGNDKDSESFVSDERLIEEFNLTLREEFEDKVPTDWDSKEDILREKLSPSLPPLPKSPLPPVIPAPPHISESLRSLDIWMCSGNDKDSESSVSDKRVMKEFDSIFSEKDKLLENLDPTDWDIVEDILRQKVSPSPPLIVPAPLQIKRCLENSDTCINPGKDKDSETSVSIKTFLEEFNLALKEDYENKVPTDWDNVGDVLEGKFSYPPPPSPPRHLPPQPSNVISAFPQFSINTNTVVSQNRYQDNMVRPPPPIFTPQGLPPSPPPPVILGPSQSRDRRISVNHQDSTTSFSNKEFIENVEWVPPKKKIHLVHMDTTDWNVTMECFREKVVLLPPPPPPPPPSQLPFPNVNSANQDNMVGPPPPTFTPQGQSAPPPPVIRAPSQSRVKRNSVNDQDSKRSVSNKDLLEDVEWLPTEKKMHFVHMDTTDWNVTKACFRENVVLPPPPIPPSSHVPPPKVISANQDYMVGPPPPTFTPQAASSPPPPPVILAPLQSRVQRNSVNHQDSSRSVSNKELSEDVEWLLPEKKKKFGHMAPSDWNVTEEFFREKAVLPLPPSLTSCPPPGILAPPCFNVKTNIVVSQDGVQDNMFRPSPPRSILHAPPHVPPPPPHPVIPAPPGLNSNIIISPPFLVAGGARNQGQILHSLPIAGLPKNVLLQPLAVVNGEVLYGVVPTPPPLNICISNRKRKHEDEEDDGRPYVKKPPNAFMLFLQEQRPKVVAELNLKNSAAVNTIMGERWRSLPEEQKAKYFDQARVEKQLHEQQHPEWSNIANYGKQRKRVRRKTPKSRSTAYVP